MVEFDLKRFVEEKEEDTQAPALGSRISPVLGSGPQRGSVTGAVFRQENILVSGYNYFSNKEEFEAEEGFNWLENMPNGYMEYAPRLSLAKSRREMDHLRNQIDAENRDKTLIAAHPVQSFFTGFVANVLDPTILLPGTQVYKVTKGTLTALRAGINVGATALTQGTIQEAALHSTQYARTLEESGMNLLSSAIIGSAIGGGTNFLLSKSGKKAINDVAKVLDDGTIGPDAKVGDSPKLLTYEAFKQAESDINTGKESGEALSAQFAGPRDLSGEELAMSKNLAKVFGVTLGRVTPLTRALTSPFRYVRKTMGEILENNLYLKKNTAEGGYQTTDHALETKIKLSYGEIDKALGDYQDVFYQMNGIDTKGFGSSIKKLVQKKSVISFEDFEQGAWLAVVRDGSDNPDFARAGKILKDRIFEPWKEKMIEIGDLPPNVSVKTALGYFTRVYNVDKINDPRFFGSWDVDNPETIYTIVKNYVLRVNNALKEQKPFIDVINKDLSRLRAIYTSANTLQKELERLKKTQFYDDMKAHKKFSSLVHEGQEKILERVEKLVDAQRLSESEILELEEALQGEINNLKVINELIKEKQLHAEDFDKFRNLEMAVANAERRRDIEISKATKALDEATVALEAEIAHFEKLKSTPEENTTYLPDVKARKQSIKSIREKHAAKIERLKGKLEKVTAIEDKNITAAEKKLEEFSSSFSKEKILTLENIVSLEERIKAAKKIKEIEYKYKDKEISLRAKAFSKFIDEQAERIYAKRNKRETLEKRLNKMEPETVKKKIEELEKKLEEDFDPAFFNSKGKVRSIIEDDSQAMTMIENIIDNIRGLNDNRYSNPLLRGMGLGAPDSTKNRHFLIPDEEIAPFLITSPSKVAPMFARGVIPHYHITTWAKENGYAQTKEEGISGKFAEIMEEYKELLLEAVKPEVKEKLEAKHFPLLEAAKEAEGGRFSEQYKKAMENYTKDLKEAADPKYAKYLSDRFKEAENDIKSVLEILMGVYGNGANAIDTKAAQIARAVGQWNFLRMMGYMVISSLTEPGQIISKSGMASFVAEGMRPMVASFEGMKKNRLLLADINRAAEGLKGSRIKNYVDQRGLSQETGLFGRAFQKAVDTYGNVSGMSFWMDAMQNIAGNVSISRTLRTIDNILSGKKVKESDRKRLAHLGIKESEFKFIHDQWKAHGGSEEGAYFINWAEWDTNTAAGLKTLESFKLATLKDLDSTIVVTGIGDKPLTSEEWYGKMLFQFKSFAFGVTNKIAISGLQRQDAEFAQGIISLLALGEITYCTTRLLKNKEISEDIEDHVYEAIDRSGVLGIIMEVPLTLQKIGLLPGSGTSRYNSRGPLSALGGPSLGAIEDITFLLNRFRNAQETPLTTKDADKILKLMPYQNIWYFDFLNRRLGLTNTLEESAGFEEAE